MKASASWCTPVLLVSREKLSSLLKDVYCEPDAMCNFMGNERWISKFDNVFHDEFASSKPTPWIVGNSGHVAGTVRTAGGEGHTAGNVTFLAVYEAG